MKVLAITITAFIISLFKGKDKDLDTSFIDLIFGSRADAPITKGDKIIILSNSAINACGVTGDIAASATILKTQTGETEISLIPPQFHMSKPTSVDDNIFKKADSELDPEKRDFYKQQAKFYSPIVALNRARTWLALDLGVQMALTGGFKHHNGTVQLGFTNREILTGIDKWDTDGKDTVADMVKWYRAMEERPDGTFMDTEAKELFLKGAKTFDNPQTGETMNFRKATPEEQERKDISETILYVGQILEIRLPVYEVIGKKVDTKGNKSNLFEPNTVLFAPMNRRDIASFEHLAIPQVEATNLGIDAKYELEREILYMKTNDQKTSGITGMLSIFTPVVRNFNYFAFRKVA